MRETLNAAMDDQTEKLAGKNDTFEAMCRRSTDDRRGGTAIGTW
ncbi:hypothetical protein Gorai_006191, partial [Gossypium raimondii]|nr:hypothetical protein [Gossypium raimondii]